MIASAMDSEGYIDLHSHVLFGVDDGPDTLEESLAVVEAMADLGYSTIYGTPHQRVGLYTPKLSSVRASREELQGAIESQGLGVKLSVGAENCWDPLLFERSQKKEIPTYEGTKAFLVEMPGPFLATGFERQLFEWRREGYLPVIAHMERYVGTANVLDRASEISGAGVVSCNLESLVGAMGRKVAKLARTLVGEGIAQVLCSDIHGKAWLKHTAKGMRWVRKNLPKGSLERLLVTNPKRILEEELPE